MNHTELLALETLYQETNNYIQQVERTIISLKNAAGACSQCMGDDDASKRHTAKVLSTAENLEKSKQQLLQLSSFVKLKIKQYRIIEETF